MAITRMTALLAGAALCLGSVATVDSTAVADDTCTGPKTISVIGVTDFHGHIENATKLAHGLANKRAENPNTVFVSAGDNVGASAFESSIDSDNPTMDILKAMGLAVSATGNHEFDQGGADLVNRVMPRIGATYVAANIGGSVPDPVKGGTVDLKKAVKPYHIQEVGGVKVAFIGAVTESLPAAVSPALNGGISVDPIAATVNKYAGELKDGNKANGEADVVVVLVHEDAQHVATGFTSASIDAVLGGHTHLKQQGKTPAGAPFIEAMNYGEAYAQLDITVACDGTVTVADTIVETKDIKPDTSNPLVARVQKLYDAAGAYAKAQGSRVLGCVTPGSTFNRGVTEPGTKTSEGGTENRGIQSTLGQLEADIALWTANQKSSTPVDLAFINSGGLRTDLDAGGNVSTANDGMVTLEEAHNVTPFGNTNAAVTLTGAQLKKVLEEQWQPIGARRPVLWLGTSSNVTYNYIPYAVDANGKVVTVTGTNDEGKSIAADGTVAYPRGAVIDLKVNGKDVQDTDTFRVAGNSFLLAGGDDFATFTKGTDFVDTGYVDFDGVMDYLAEFTKVEDNQCVKGLTAPEVRNTAGVSKLAVDPAARTAEVTVSGLAFSTDEPVPAGAYVSVNGVPLGYFDNIERQAVPTLTPEMGLLTAKAEGLCDAAIDKLTSVSLNAMSGIDTAEVVLGARTAELDSRFDVTQGVCAVPAEEPADEPTSDPTTEPVGMPAEEPTTEPVDEPTAEPVDEPVAAPAEGTVDEPAAAATEPSAKSTANSTKRKTKKPLYANCNEVLKKVGHSIKKGEKGYRAALDTDGDGIACETEAKTKRAAAVKAAKTALSKTGTAVGGMMAASALLTAAGFVLVRRKMS